MSWEGWVGVGVSLRFAVLRGGSTGWAGAGVCSGRCTPLLVSPLEGRRDWIVLPLEGGEIGLGEGSEVGRLRGCGGG